MCENWILYASHFLHVHVIPRRSTLCVCCPPPLLRGLPGVSTWYNRAYAHIRVTICSFAFTWFFLNLSMAYLHHSWPASNWSWVRLRRVSKYEFALKKVNLTIVVIVKLRASFSTPLKHSDSLVIIAPYRRPPSCASVHFSLFSASRYLCAAGLTLRINSSVASNFLT